VYRKAHISKFVTDLIRTIPPDIRDRLLALWSRCSSGREFDRFRLRFVLISVRYTSPDITYKISFEWLIGYSSLRFQSHWTQNYFEKIYSSFLAKNKFKYCLQFIFLRGSASQAFPKSRSIAFHNNGFRLIMKLGSQIAVDGMLAEGSAGVEDAGIVSAYVIEVV